MFQRQSIRYSASNNYIAQMKFNTVENSIETVIIIIGEYIA